MKTILVPTDFSKYSTNAILTASAIAKMAGGEIILMHNVKTLLTRWERLPASEQHKHPEVLQRSNEGLTKLQELEKSGHLNNIPVRKIITHGVTSDEIVRIAKENNVDIIVLGSHGNTPEGRDFIASTFQRVIREATCPVLCVKKPGDYTWKKVVLPDTFDFDISKPFEKVRQVAEVLGSTIQLLYINTGNFRNTDTINQRMEAFQARYPTLKFERIIYDHADIDKGILQFVEVEKPDYIAMITYDHKHHPKYLVSVTDTVVYHANIPVLTVCVNSAAVEDSVTIKKDMARTL